MANILITGAGSGLGRGAALGLAHAGHHVIASCEIWSQVRDLRSDAQRQGVDLDVIKLDVTDDIDRTHAFGYDVDILVLNAGVQEAGSVVEIPMARIRRSFEINVFGHVQLVQGFAPQMLNRDSELGPRGIRVGTTNPGPYRTGYNDTGAEAMFQWWSDETALLERPDFSDYLANQYDPQEMIDAMVRTIPADHHAYRTVRPEV
ncbi:MAG TPA: SDR family NAD(P)-dependent oxidoreductase, partial [Micromonosporaceae bacterium]|nr:SDR family NAD(P)-dependent oxidoreductase [Micromonosporaceae bacterium]